MRGFTLIELLVVVAILSILAVVGVPAYTGYVQSARDKEAQLMLRTIAAAQETYRMYNQSYFGVACDEASPQRISQALLSGARIDSTYFNFCSTVNAANSRPNFIVRAFNAAKEFRLDQDGNELTVVDGVSRPSF
jgi:prepilin-type N-terminal cleavage/methylation domain-containing protein